jgi:hypothetical protein
MGATLKQVNAGTYAAVYRAFDADDRLLYVGCSIQWPLRLGQHAADKPWWKDVARVELTHYDSWPEALKAEGRAQVDESPAHNVVRNGRIPDMRERRAARRAEREADEPNRLARAKELREKTWWKPNGTVSCTNCGRRPELMPPGRKIEDVMCSECGCTTFVREEKAA